MTLRGVASQSPGAVAITGGTINNTVIGGVTPAAITGTAIVGSNLAVTGAASFLTVPNVQTGTTYTLVAADSSKLLTFNNAAATTVTLPQQSTLTTAAGFWCRIRNLGAGTVTLVKEGSETLTGNTTLVTAAEALIERPTTTNWAASYGTAVITEQMIGSVDGTIVNQAYDIIVRAPYAGTIISLTTKSTTTAVAGTYTVAISGVSVTGLTTIANGASGVRTNTAASGANAFVAGDYITITLAGATITDLFWTLEYTRTY